MRKKIAIIVGGCGHKDGSEIHETTMTMLAVAKQGADYQLFAPDREQYHVLNHLTGEVMNEKRNLLIEAARIARGNILPLEKFNVENFDAVIFPGGFGVAKNFFDYALKGVDCQVDTEIASIIKSTHAAQKPIGALCISPVLIAKVIDNVTITIGKDAATASDIQTMGSKNINADYNDVVIDRKNKIFSTPCYMLNVDIAQIAEGAENLVKAILENISSN
ncbi:MAG: isoprenoid biosynthesis glyoxalase ElbB [Bacteroidales bacterium]|jgi:enhancing lycopene biosynthesis protein 2|nr:isoprenoid biosynthesis glyoxalase ElbB [Bacteroidales bacterium]